jgi:sodium/proline symporter
MLIAFIIYLVVVIGIGLFVIRYTKTDKDYYIGGGKLPGWALALSERSTDMSAWLMLSVPALAYTLGVSALWVPLGCFIGSVIQWVFYSRRLREAREKYDAVTVVDYLAKKHSEGEKAIRVIGAIICFVFFIAYVSAQFAGGGKILARTFNIPVMPGMVITAIIVIGYCMAGGFLSVVWTDVIQAILMVITLVVVPIIGLSRMSVSLGQALRSFDTMTTSWLGGKTGIAAGLLIGVHMSWIFGYLGGEPHFVIRQMAIRNERERKQAMTIAIIWGILTTFGAWLLGLVALSLFGPSVVADAEQILPWTVMHLVPPFLGGILLAGAIAGMMSTADSQLVIASSSIVEDLYSGIIKKGKIAKRVALKISRFVTLIAGILAFLFAITSERVVYTLVSYGWSGLAAAFAPAITLSLWWKRFGKIGTLTALIVGPAVTIFWIVTGMDKILTVRLASFLISILITVIVTIIFSKGGAKGNTNLT